MLELLTNSQQEGAHTGLKLHWGYLGLLRKECIFIITAPIFFF